MAQNDDWQARIGAMEADAAFMRWMRGYNPDVATSYSGDLLGMYDAWMASRAGRCATCRWAEVKDPRDTAGDEVGASLACSREDAMSNPPPFTTFTGPFFVSPTFGCVQWEAKP